MAVEDLNRQLRTPATGTDAGNQSVVDFNLKINPAGVLYIPYGSTNTFNGGKTSNGAIRITNGVLTYYYNGSWITAGSGSKIIIIGDQDDVTLDNGYGKLSVPLTDENLFTCVITPSIEQKYNIPNDMLLNGVLFGFPNPDTTEFTFKLTYL